MIVIIAAAGQPDREFESRKGGALDIESVYDNVVGDQMHKEEKLGHVEDWPILILERISGSERDASKAYMSTVLNFVNSEVLRDELAAYLGFRECEDCEIKDCTNSCPMKRYYLIPRLADDMEAVLIKIGAVRIK